MPERLLLHMTQIHIPGVNRLLALLPEEDYRQLSPFLEHVTTPIKQSIYEANKPVPYVYFPLSMVTSLLVTLHDGIIVEIATVGNEGIVGLPVFLGADTIPGSAIVQIPGEAMRMASAPFREAFEYLPSLRNLLQRYTQALFTLVAQSVACNRAHTIQQRCARWLLMTQDRIGSEQFALTQEFLAEMLGVRRAGVSEVASNLQQAGFIQYTRGMITVLDRAGLEDVTCECYWVVRDEFERTLN